MFVVGTVANVNKVMKDYFDCFGNETFFKLCQKELHVTSMPCSKSSAILNNYSCHHNCCIPTGLYTDDIKGTERTYHLDPA